VSKRSYSDDPHDLIRTYSTIGEVPEASCLIPMPELSESARETGFPRSLTVSFGL
jgi:hypothetical protein